MRPFKLLFTRKIKAARELITNPYIQLTELELVSITQLDDPHLSQQIAAIPDNAFLAFTSANAVEYFINLSHRISAYWKVCCLEGATRNAVVELLKIDRVYLAAATAALLADEIIRDGACERMTFICGNKRRNELPDKLRQSGIEVDEIVVYNTEPAPKTIDGNFDGIAFFSPSAVESFFMKNKVDADVVLFSIGVTTTEVIKSYSSNKIITSSKSTEQSIIESVEQYMNKKSGTA